MTALRLSVRQKDQQRLGAYFPHGFWAEHDPEAVSYGGFWMGFGVVSIVALLDGGSINTRADGVAIIYCGLIFAAVLLFRSRYGRAVGAAWEAMRRDDPERFRRVFIEDRAA